ncbi:hypothetical protein, partial [Pantoea dispersa]
EFNEFFVKKIGVTLDELADRYDMGLGGKLDVIIQELTNKVENVRAEIKEINDYNKELENRLFAVYSSNSWRMTAPLRRVIDLGKRTDVARKKGLKYLAKALVRKIFQRLVRVLGKYPRARSNILVLMRKIGIYSLLRKIYLKSVSGENNQYSYNNFFPTSHIDKLTNRAKEIYEDLHKDEIKNNKGD